MSNADFERVVSRAIRESAPPRRVFRRTVRTWLAVTGAVVVLAASFAVGSALQAWHAERSPAAQLTPSESPCPSSNANSGSPRTKPTPDDVSGVVDLPYPFERGAIRVRVAVCRDIGAILQKYGLTHAEHWNAPPYSAADIATGLDRSYRISVPEGSEKDCVVRLASHEEDFDWVELIWQYPMGSP